MLFRMDGRLIKPGPLDAVETARLRLERWDDAHFDRFARFMRDPDVIRYIRPDPLEGARATEQHERSLEEWDTNGFGKRAMIESATDEWLGFVELSRVGPGKGCRDEDVEIGYFVAPSRWGEGIATEAATATRDEAFERAKLDELIGRCRVENARSARVLQKRAFSYSAISGSTRVSRSRSTTSSAPTGRARPGAACGSSTIPSPTPASDYRADRPSPQRSPPRSKEPLQPSATTSSCSPAPRDDIRACSPATSPPVP